MWLVMNTAVTRNEWVGRVIDGRFPLLEWIGNTEQAGVFRTELKGPQPRRAVIRLVPSLPEHAEALLESWRQAAALSHPHLMHIYSCGRAQVGGGELLYVVTDFADEALGQVIPERPLSSGEARDMLGPIFDALAYLHSQGKVHGSIKPSNIMVVGDNVKLPVESVRPAGGAPPARLSTYDAPERASGATLPASDIWALGITLVEAMTQHPPVWDRAARREPVVPAEMREPYASIARACLRFDAGKRASLRELKSLLNPPPSMAEPANEMDQLAPAEVTVEAPVLPEQKPRWNRRTVGIAGGILALVALIIYALSRPHPSAPAAPAAPTPAPPVAQVQHASPAPPTPPPSTGVVKGEVVDRAMPDVAASANRTIHGKVEERIRVDVDSAGGVQDARNELHSQSRYFASKALDAARKWRFKPAQRDGKTIPSTWRLRFFFRRSGPEVNAAEIQP
jgi:TonB family protein